jgi:hypothetical protein
MPAPSDKDDLGVPRAVQERRHADHFLDLVDQIFDVLVRDVAKFALQPKDLEPYLEDRILCDRKSVLARLKRKIRARLGDFIYSWEDVPLAMAVGALLKKDAQRLPSRS